MGGKQSIATKEELWTELLSKTTVREIEDIITINILFNSTISCAKEKIMTADVNFKL